MTPTRILALLLGSAWLAFVFYCSVRIVGGGVK